MKTIRSLLFVITGICLLIACEKSEELFSEDASGETLKCTRGHNPHSNGRHWKPGPKMVTLPFKDDFVGNYDAIEVSEICGDYPWMRVINNGGGTGTYLGSFTHHFDFCCEVENGYYPGGHMEAYFVAANGDTLFVACAGQVIEGRAEDHLEYVVSYFRDPFQILGGTGRFKGATGRGMTDDYNSSEDPYSHHHWKGIITMVKGKP